MMIRFLSTLTVVCAFRSQSPKLAPSDCISRRHLAEQLLIAGSLPFVLPTAARATAPPATAAVRLSFKPAISDVEGRTSRLQFSDEVAGPKGSKKSYRVSFQYPRLWTPIGQDIEVIDGNSGTLAYLVAAPLPDGASLSSLPRAWFGESLFEPQGKLVRRGVSIDSFRVTSSALLERANSDEREYRQLGLKYATVGGSGRTIDRKGLVTACEAAGLVYMFVATANAVRWDNDEKKIVEMSGSFHLEPANAISAARTEPKPEP